ncbi:MAG TPA: PilZ domain-containing protein [Planctomycetaceae bacterium]|nr:PilZ domain-containing protein [Planctomycetaceae bacterium]
MNTSDSSSTDEQRYFPRRAAAGFVSVVRFPPGAELTPQWTDWLMQTSGLTGELVDLSRSGLALVLLQPFAAGDALVVRLSQQDSDDTLDAVVEVVRSIDLGDQRWKIMAQFTKPLDFEEAYEFASHDQDALPPLFPAT